jgi:predicted helicase
MATDFPPPLNKQAAKFPKALLWLLIAAGFFGAFLLWVSGAALYRGNKQANMAVQHFHQELNDGQYDKIYQKADDGFRKATTQDEGIRLFQDVHTKLGNATDAKVSSLNISTNTKGTFITIAYNSTFTRGAAAETFKWLRKGSDLALDSYNVKSNVFGTQ